MLPKKYAAATDPRAIGKKQRIVACFNKGRKLLQSSIAESIYTIELPLPE